MTKQFDIKFRPQIESGEYKVETREGLPVRIICWDKKGATYPIVTLVTIKNSNEEIMTYTDEGTYYKNTSPEGRDLIIVTPEEELTEFESNVRTCITENLTTHIKDGDGVEISSTVFIDDDTTKKTASELLSIAREEFIKNDYIIEKKAFHDAVENISDKHLAEIGIEYSLHCKVKDGTRHAIMNWEAFQKVAQKFIDIGKAETVEKYKQSWFNEGKIAGRFEGLTEDEKYQQGVHDGKEEALKDLPRWTIYPHNAGDEPIVNGILQKAGSYAWRLYLDGYKIEISDLTKLPGFKED